MPVGGVSVALRTVTISLARDQKLYQFWNSTIDIFLFYFFSDVIPSILECALMAINLDHKDANGSVMKFIFDLFHLGRSKEEREDFELRSAIVHRFRLEYGSR